MLKNTPAQYKKEHEILREVDSLALANAHLNQEKAYKNFFRDQKIGWYRLPGWGSPAKLGDTYLMRDIDQEVPTSTWCQSFKWWVVHGLIFLQCAV